MSDSFPSHSFLPSSLSTNPFPIPFPLMSFLPFLFFLLLCTSPVVFCDDDDTQGLRYAVGCLCSVQSSGEFHSCCESHLNGTSLTLSDPQCFISSLTLDSKNQHVLKLFVFHHFLQSPSLFISFYCNQKQRTDFDSIWLFLLSLQFGFFSFLHLFIL